MTTPTDSRIIIRTAGKSPSMSLTRRSITLRADTEWVETVQAGWNVLVGANREAIVDAALGFAAPAARPALYGEGGAVLAIMASIG